MKDRLLILLASSVLPLVALLLLAAVSYTRTETPAGPRMEFARTVFDAGSVVSHRAIEHDFHFRNTGNEALVVYSINSDCEGSSETQPSRTIAPGEWGWIHVRYFPAKSRGISREIFVVDSNATSKEKVKLEIRAHVERNLRFVPNILPFGFLETDETVVKTVRLENRSDSPLRIVRLIAEGGEWLRLEIDELPPSLKPGEGFSFEVLVEPERERRSRYTGTIVAQADVDDSEIRMPVTAQMHTFRQITPR